jgi:hypothetical protein
MAINVAPKGRSVGYTGQTPVGTAPAATSELTIASQAESGQTGFDPLTEKLLKVIRKGNEMEDSTENAIKQMEQGRADSLSKVQK